MSQKKRAAQSGFLRASRGRGFWYKASLVLLVVVAVAVLAGICLMNRLKASPQLFVLYWLTVIALALALLLSGVMVLCGVAREYRELRQELKQRLGIGSGRRKGEKKL